MARAVLTPLRRQFVPHLPAGLGSTGAAHRSIVRERERRVDDRGMLSDAGGPDTGVRMPQLAVGTTSDSPSGSVHDRGSSQRLDRSAPPMCCVRRA